MSGERTEKPTPKRLREARREGRIPRSPELTMWASVLVATIAGRATLSSGSKLVIDLTRRMESVAARPDPATALALFGDGLKGAAVAAAPLVGALMVVGIAGNLAQVGFHPTTHTLKPKLSRLNPFQGMRRLFSASSWWEGGKGLIKTAILGFLAWRTVRSTTTALVGSGPMPLARVVSLTGSRALTLARDAAAAGLVLAAIDYGIQRRRVNKQLRMTKQEVKQEHKNAEGDPRLKGAIRERQLRMSRMRMMADVARADVVIVNPTHVAVALRYDGAAGAPRVVAKGAGDVAARIREEAEKHRVPMVQDVPLARTIFRACDLGDEIPPELYEAVARVLAFVFSLKARGVVAGAHLGPAPMPAMAGR